MKVAVKMVGTQAGGCYELAANPMATVSQLKLSLDADHGVSAENHELLYGGKVLKDTETLTGANFVEHGVLACVLLTEGAASKKSAALHADSEEDAPAMQVPSGAVEAEPSSGAVGGSLADTLYHTEGIV